MLFILRFLRRDPLSAVYANAVFNHAIGKRTSETDNGFFGCRIVN